MKMFMKFVLTRAEIGDLFVVGYTIGLTLLALFCFLCAILLGALSDWCVNTSKRHTLALTQTTVGRGALFVLRAGV